MVVGGRRAGYDVPSFLFFVFGLSLGFLAALRAWGVVFFFFSFAGEREAFSQPDYNGV